MTQKVLVTGAGGFIGHHLALGLKKVGAEVLIIDDLQINNVTKILTDLNDLNPFQETKLCALRTS